MTIYWFYDNKKQLLVSVKAENGSLAQDYLKERIGNVKINEPGSAIELIEKTYPARKGVVMTLKVSFE